ncbi:hypothetical protein P3T76_003044 [Phytophthora citrophthora]|uniref:Uncharacterized protein n=1 Tax=Phytophthora citrophthora TaxID=4793 RepID=A0AAD9LRJ1_9STRA|nr:hypothetical protein P3T76_003044 [Phytophthora citrophthora]
MKRSAIGWIKNPFFLHGVGVGLDTASAAAGGAIGAGMSGQDVGTHWSSVWCLCGICAWRNQISYSQATRPGTHYS